tara:strand:+ start:1559 stop:3175 length:1617 start_codon:yes stop_codon:yes gene_type:complete
MSVDVKNGTNIADYVSAGRSYEGGALAVDTVSAITHVSNGLNYTANQRLAASLDIGIASIVGGIPLDSSGRVAMSSGAVSYYANGLPFTLDGHIAVTQSTRYFTDFTSSLSQYITLSSPVTLSGDFEIECDFATTTNDGGFQVIFGNESWTAILGFALIVQHGVVKYRAGGTAEDLAGTINVSDGELHTVKLTRVGTTHTITVDGVIDISGARTVITTANATPAYAGARHNNDGTGSTDHFDGIISNLKITDGTTLVVDMPIDEDGSDNVVVNKAAVVGAELVVNGTFDTDVSGWSNLTATSSHVSGAIEVTHGSPASGSYQAFTTLIGETYKVSGEVVSSMGYSGATVLRVGNGANPDAGITSSSPFTAPSTKTIYFTATGTTSYVYLRNDANSVTVWDNISVKQISQPYGTRTNMTTTDTWLATQGDGEWLGAELVVSPLLTGFWVDNGDATYTNTVAYNQYIYPSGTFDAFGFPTLMTLTVSGSGSGSVKVDSTTVGTGTHTIVRPAGVFNRISSGAVGIVVSDISIKRLLTEAT